MYIMGPHVVSLGKLSKLNTIITYMPRKSVASTGNIGGGKASMTRNVSLALQKADCYLNNNIIYIRPILYCKQIASVNVAIFRSHSYRWRR